MSADSEREGGDANPPEGANAWWVAACCAGLAVASAAWHLQRESLHADVASGLSARLASQDEQLREQSWQLQMLQGSIEDLNSEFAARVVALERGEAARKSALEKALAQARESVEVRAPLQTASTQASSAGSGGAPEALAPGRKPGSVGNTGPPETEGSRERLVATMQAWWAYAGRRAEVAEALHVHPQTVRYRMGRVRELYGEAWEDPEVVRALGVVLAGRRGLVGRAGLEPATGRL